MVLSGTNTYTGVTTVNAGTLELTTTNLDAACLDLPREASRLNLVLHRFTSPDADLESLYRQMWRSYCNQG